MKPRIGAAERFFHLVFFCALAIGGLLVIVNQGHMVADRGHAAFGPGLLLLALLVGLGLLRYSRRCPMCGGGRFPRQPSNGIYTCAACGARFRRVRQGSAVQLSRKPPPLEDDERFGCERVGAFELLPQPPDDRWTWIKSFLPRLRALRQQLRPLAAKPARVLNLMKSAPVDLDLPAQREPSQSADPPPRRVTLRGSLALASATLAVSATVLSMVPSLARLGALDDGYFIIVLVATCVCELMVLVMGQMLQLTRTASLAMLIADLALKALHLAAIGRLPDPYALGSMAIVFPTTPLLLSLFFRHWRAAEEEAGEFTTGQLLRNKQTRASARAGRNLPGTRRAG